METDSGRPCPLIAVFLHRAFIVSNHRRLSRADLASTLEDFLFVLRETEGEKAFPKRGETYLDDWASDDKGWLRKFYPPGSDEAHYDLMPWVEKALTRLESLEQRTFMGTKSRLMTIFELLKQMEGIKYSDDKWDALWLAHLLKFGILPQGYIYPKDTAALLTFCPGRLKDRKKAKSNRAVAIKALSNKLARASYYMMRDQVPVDSQMFFA